MTTAALRTVLAINPGEQIIALQPQGENKEGDVHSYTACDTMEKIEPAHYLLCLECDEERLPRVKRIQEMESDWKGL